jgi:plasmid stabilization system protein ParE
MIVIWNTSAIADLASLRAYIALDNTIAADKVAASITRAANSLAAFPHL